MLSLKEQSIPGVDRAARAGWELEGACTVGGALEGMWEDSLLRMPSLCPGPFLLCSGTFESQTTG